MTSRVNEPSFWEERYKDNLTPWDIGETAPAFVKYFSSFNEIIGEKNIAVLGCGFGHDAFYLANNNEYKVKAFDFSESAIKHCNQIKESKKIENINFYQVDIFELAKNKEWENCFDYVIEHTCFCAIDPHRRSEYIDLIKYLLKPGGKLVGLFFMRNKELGGPPYGSTPEIIKDFFKKDFKEIIELHLEPCLHTNLEGNESFAVYEKL